MSTLRDIWRRFSRREQQMLVWGGVAAAGIILYVMMIDPLLSRMTLLETLIPQQQAELEQLARLREDYTQLKGRVARLDRQAQSMAPDFSLLALLETTVQEQVGKTHLAGIRPMPSLPFEDYEETVVEVQLERVTLGQVVAFLSGLEQSSSRPRIKRLEVKSRFKAEEMLDAKIEVAAYQRKSPSSGSEGERPRPS